MATRSKISNSAINPGSNRSVLCKSPPFTKEFKIDIARFEIPVSGWTCLRTKQNMLIENKVRKNRRCTFVDVRGVGFFSCLVALLFFSSGSSGFFARFFLLSRCLSSWGLSAS